MASTLRIAFIGAGFVNFGGPEGPWDHASRLEKMSKIHFVGILDLNKERAENSLKKRQTQENLNQRSLWNDCKLYTDLNEMIKDAKPHAVFIGVPPVAHGSFTNPIELTCVQANVHCFVEKPVSNGDKMETLAYADKIRERNPEAILSVGYMFRHSKWVKHILKTIKKHGKPVVSFNAQFTCSYANVNNQFWWDCRHSGGPIVEQATHLIDIARYIVGEVDFHTIKGSSVPPSDTKNSVGHLEAIPKTIDETKIPQQHKVPRSTTLNWKFKSRAIGTLVHNVLSQRKVIDAKLEIFADGLQIRAESPYTDNPKVKIFQGNSDEEKVFEFPNDDPYYTEAEEFISVVRQHVFKDGKSSDKLKNNITCDFKDGAKTYALSCAMREASTKSN